MSEEPQPMRSPARARLWLGLAALLWAAYALPLYAPPAQVACGTAMPPDAGLLERVFPDVPGWWMGLRLLALGGAVVLAGLSVWRCMPATLPVRPGPAPAIGGAVWVAMAFAAAELVAGTFAADFTRPVQLGYIAALAAPALLLLFAYRPSPGPANPRLLGGLLLLAGAWAVLRLLVSLDSPRTADTVDTFGQLALLQETQNAGLNLLSGRALKGVSFLPFVVQGVGVVGTVLPLDLALLQGINVAWTAVVAVGLGWIAARLIAPAAAPITAAAFLWSPFMLLGPLVPIPMFHGVLIATTLVLLLIAIHAHRSPPAIAAFGVVAGIGCSHPPTAPFAALACAVGLWSARQAPRVPWPLVVLALLCFAATVWPGLPSPATVQAMVDAYARAGHPWRALEFAVLGQLPPADALALRGTAVSRPFDILAGAILAPAAIPRTAIRLWGDALFEPLGIGLALTAGVAAVLAVRRSVPARLLLAVVALGLLPGVVSTYDRPSLTRMSILPLGMALAAGMGFELLRRTLGGGRRMGAVIGVTIAIAVGGTLLFDRVTPRILPASAFGLALESLGGNAARPAVALDYDDWQLAWLGRIGHTAPFVREPAVAVVRYAASDSLTAIDGTGPSTPVVFWSPGLERHGAVTAAICARWPAARLYTISDRPGCSQVHAAVLDGTPWEPAVPRSRWRVRGCDDA